MANICKWETVSPSPPPPSFSNSPRITLPGRDREGNWQQFSWIIKQSCFEATGFSHEMSSCYCDSYSDDQALVQGCKLVKYKLTEKRREGQHWCNTVRLLGAVPHHMSELLMEKKDKLSTAKKWWDIGAAVIEVTVNQVSQMQQYSIC